MNYLDTFEKTQAKLVKQFGIDKAHLTWVMAQVLEEADLAALAAAALTDGPEDKKIDFIYLDSDNKRIVVTQGYFSTKHKDTAPANKASDLNTAAAWLFSGDLSVVPKELREVINDCRTALAADEIESIELYYVHNLPESVNVSRELQTVEDHVRKALPSAGITVRATELGLSRIQQLSDAQDSHIVVKDSIPFPSKISFQEKGAHWQAYVASIPGQWLHTLYQKHNDALFSANYRGFLGVSRRKRVNSGIQNSAEARPTDFWAFNNGITILTMGMKEDKSGTWNLNGISIINGAQTTGSIGSVDVTKKPIADVRVLCRVIESSDSAVIADIVRFNNTQNVITSWDQYSNDPDQKRLVLEFKEYGFSYSIKRGFVGTGDELSVDEVIQPLLAFHGKPADAIRGRNQIFDRKALYNDAFSGKKARHVLFVYTLARAIDEVRISLKEKSNAGNIIAVEAEQLSLMRNLRFKSFFIALVARCIETAIGKKCDPHTIAFSTDAAKETLNELAARWIPVINVITPLITADEDAKTFSSRLSDEKFLDGVAKKVNALLQAMKASETLKSFADLVSDS